MTWHNRSQQTQPVLGVKDVYMGIREEKIETIVMRFNSV